MFAMLLHLNMKTDIYKKTTLASKFTRFQTSQFIVHVCGEYYTRCTKCIADLGNAKH